MSNQSIFEVVLAKTNIINVISKYIDVSQKGKNYWAICPFHNDTKPSLSVSEEKQIYKCFSCGAGGNSIKFVKDMDSLSNIEALKKVAAICNIDIDLKITNNPKRQKYDQEQLEIIEINNKAKDFYSLMLKSKEGSKALTYLENRNLDESIIEEFGIGFAPGDDQLIKLIQSFDYQELTIANSGLFSLPQNKFFDFFSNRIIFPILDQNGDAVAFSGRIYQKDDVRAKYANSPESKVFTKSKILYNISKAKAHLIHNKEIVIVEGFMDVIALYKAGIKNVVATMGTAFSQTHIKILKEHTNMVNIFMDSDDAGQKFTFNLVKDLVQNGFEVKLVQPIENMDVDDIYLKLGKEKLVELVTSSQKVFQYLINNVITKIDTTNIESVTKFKNFATILINNYKNREEATTFRDILKTKLNIKIDFDKQLESSQMINTSIAPETKINVADKWERKLVANMIKNKDAADYYKTKLHFLPNKIRKQVADYIIEFYKKNDLFNVKVFEKIIENKAEILAEFKIINKMSKQTTYHKKEFEDLIKAMKDKITRELQIKDINLQIKENEDILVKAELLQERHNIKKGI